MLLTLFKNYIPSNLFHTINRMYRLKGMSRQARLTRLG